MIPPAAELALATLVAAVALIVAAVALARGTAPTERPRPVEVSECSTPV